jgi:hypothetical protein
MEFKFQQTFTRSALQGRAEEMRRREEAEKLERLRTSVRQYVEMASGSILNAAATGKTFYLYVIAEQGLRLPDYVHTDDLLRGFQEKFPDCTVTLSEEWVDVPGGRGGNPLRALKSGIKIDWA